MSLVTLSAQRVLRLTMAAMVGGLAAWCAWSFRTDLQQLSVSTIWHSRDLVLLAILFSLTNYLSRSLRWRWYLQRLGHRLTIGFSIRTYVAGFAFTLSPAKVGELIRARYYRGHHIPLTHIVAATIVERVMDLLAMGALALLILHAFPEWRSTVWIAISIVAVCAGLLAILPLKRLAGARQITRSRLFATFFGEETLDTLMCTRALLTPQAIFVGLLLGVTAWGLEGLGLAVLSGMVPTPQLGTLVASGIYAIAVLIGALSFLPGGLGGTETTMAALLVARGHSVADAALITLTCRVVTLWLAVCLGWLAVFSLRGRTGSSQLRTL